MIPRSENKKAMNCNKRSAQRLKLTAINKQEARSEKHNTTAKIGEQIDDEIAVRMKTYKTYLAKDKKSKSQKKLLTPSKRDEWRAHGFRVLEEYIRLHFQQCHLDPSAVVSRGTVVFYCYYTRKTKMEATWLEVYEK